MSSTPDTLSSLTSCRDLNESRSSTRSTWSSLKGASFFRSATETTTSSTSAAGGDGGDGGEGDIRGALGVAPVFSFTGVAPAPRTATNHRSDVAAGAGAGAGAGDGGSAAASTAAHGTNTTSPSGLSLLSISTSANEQGPNVKASSLPPAASTKSEAAQPGADGGGQGSLPTTTGVPPGARVESERPKDAASPEVCVVLVRRSTNGSIGRRGNGSGVGIIGATPAEAFPVEHQPRVAASRRPSAGKEGGVGAASGGRGGGGSAAGEGATASVPRCGRAGPTKVGKGKGRAKKRSAWGGKDWGGQAVSQRAKDEILAGVSLWSVSQDGTLVGEDGNHFFCSVCGESGDITCCDECPRVFHEECLPSGTDSHLAANHQTEEDLWYCPSCTNAGRVNLVAGREPNWTQEDRAQMAKWEETRVKKPHKARPQSSLEKAGGGGARREEPSPVTISPLTASGEKKARCKNPKRAAAAAAAAAATASAVSLTVVNINAVVDPPCYISRAQVFSPELDNLLLRSLLYEEKYVHIVARHAVRRPRPRNPTPAYQQRSAAGRGALDLGRKEGGVPRTTGNIPGDGRDASNRRGRTDGSKRKGEELGALAAHLPLSRRAGKRPKHHAYTDKRRLGAPFAEALGPARVFDGTAVSFGARATGPFRAGLAATMVEMGLVLSEVATETGYPEFAQEERFLTQQAEKRDAAAGAEGSSRVFDSAGDGWRSRVPSPKLTIGSSSWKPQPAESSVEEEQALGRVDTAHGARNSGDHSGTSEGFPAQDTETQGDGGDGSAGGWGQTRAGGRVSDHMDVEGDERGGVQHGAGGSGTGQGSAGSGGGPIHARGTPSSTGSNDEGVGGGGSKPPKKKQDNAPPTAKARTAGGGGGGGGVGDHEKTTLGKNDPLRKENRMWNLKHMRATQEGKMDVCAYCRLHPDGGLMVCSTPELAKIHSFCFPCLRRNNGIKLSDLTGGDVKWVCPPCLERKARPKRNPHPPSTLGGAARAGDGVPTSAGGPVPRRGRGQPAGGGRSREPDRGVAGAGKANVKRSSSSSSSSGKLPAAAAPREKEVHRRAASGPAEKVLPTFRSANSGSGGVDATKPRRDGTPLGAVSGSGGGTSGGEASGVGKGVGSGKSVGGDEIVARGSIGGDGGGGGTTGGGTSGGAGGGSSGGGSGGSSRGGTSGRSTSREAGEGGSGGGPKGGGLAGVWAVQALPGQLPIERRRLLRMVATFVLDRLQQLDPLNLFKDPVPDGVEGYAEAIEHPIDFSTIRRRSQWELYGSIHQLALDVQLLCANARTFNDPGTVYHKAAGDVLKGAERIWPQAQTLLDRLTSAETEASRHNIMGPAASSDAWPLDGPFAGFELTPRNEDAYYMHVAIRRASAAARTRAEQETGAGMSASGGGKKRRANGVAGGRGGRVEATAVDVAVAVASSPALLYTRRVMGEEESALRESLSLYRADCIDKALRRTVGSAKCEAIDLSTLHKRKANTLSLPTPVTRQFVAPDGEFLSHTPVRQPVPRGPNPSLRGKVKSEATKVVMPEWKVLQAAHGARQRFGEEAARHMRAFRGLLKEVAVVSRTRLRLGKSAVQGLGVFTTQAIGAHELVVEYVGEVVKLAEVERRVALYRRTKLQEYVVRAGEDEMFIDATRKGNLARFLNHSCDPNVYMLAVTAGKGESLERRVCFFSLRKIPAGEELVYSYPAPHTVGLGGAAVAVECACRAPECRGRQSKKEDQL